MLEIKSLENYSDDELAAEVGRRLAAMGAGMYGAISPLRRGLKLGGLFVCDWTQDDGESVWIQREDEDGNPGDGGQLPKAPLAAMVEKYFDAEL